jgi:pilus assembly protein CpaE
LSTLEFKTPRRTLSIVTVSVDRPAAAALREIVTSLSEYTIAGEIEKPAASNGTLLHELQRHQPDVCILDFDGDRTAAVMHVEQIRALLPGTAVFAISADAQPDSIVEAMRAGCSEYLLKPPVRERVKDALVKHGQRRRDRNEPSRRGKLHTFIGVKGGSGVTALTTHLAAMASRAGIRTLLIDHHPALGDVSVYLNLGKHQFHFFELVHNIHRLDSELLQGFVVKHSSGAHVLAAPDAFDSGTEPSAEELRSTLDFLRGEYDLVLIDCAPGLNAANLSTIDRSDSVHLVAVPELPSVRNLVRYLEHLKHFDLPAEKMRVIVNRYDKRSAIRDVQIERTIHQEISHLIPNCYAEMLEAIHSGMPATAPVRTEFGVAMERWIETLTERPVVRQEPKRRLGILGL